MSQLDQNATKARGMIVKKMLTTCMRDQLKDEEADYDKVRKSGRGIVATLSSLTTSTA